MSKELLGSIVEIARGVGAYILCDEVYRHLTQEDEWCESIVDLYEKGISVSSMSKVFSLAGLRMGWIATHDEAARKAFLSHRDYNLISCGMFDDAIASIALRHSDVMLKRNQRIVRENLAILDDWIKENPHFFYTKPKAGKIPIAVPISAEMDMLPILSLNSFKLKPKPLTFSVLRMVISLGWTASKAAAAISVIA